VQPDNPPTQVSDTVTGTMESSASIPTPTTEVSPSVEAAHSGEAPITPTGETPATQAEGTSITSTGESTTTQTGETSPVQTEGTQAQSQTSSAQVDTSSEGTSGKI
jgi:hypothetical protein